MGVGGFVRGFDMLNGLVLVVPGWKRCDCVRVC